MVYRFGNFIVYSFYRPICLVFKQLRERNTRFFLKELFIDAPSVFCSVLYLIIKFNLLKPRGFLPVPPGLTFKNSTCRHFCVECFVRISEQTATFALYVIDWLIFITVVESVYCAVRTDSLYKAGYFSSLKVKEEMLQLCEISTTPTVMTERHISPSNYS